MITHTDVGFRSATPNDQAAIARFQIAMARETESLELDAATCAAGVRGVFEVPARGRYFVAEKAGQIVACLLTTCEWSEWRNGQVWWIQSVYVEPACRKEGIYRGLYAYIREQAQADPSIRGIRLYVDKRNVAAQKVYVSLGMNGDHYQLFEWMKTF